MIQVKLWVNKIMPPLITCPRGGVQIKMASLVLSY
jgi:hypothetical protein